MLKISASLAAANLLDMRLCLNQLNSIPVDSLHYDLEDGCFTPVMSLGLNLLQQLDTVADQTIDVHLMIKDPEWILSHLPTRRVRKVSVHYEACLYPRRVLRKIYQLGFIPGLAFNLATPILNLDFLEPYLHFVLVLSSDPEEKNSPFVPQAIEKIIRGKNLNFNKNLEWQIDGGINPQNLSTVVQMGVTSVVVGRALFSKNEIQKNWLVLNKIGSKT
ncbi:MAG: hypothetical protein VB108_00545 [Anaerolineaceae bacterium]|nr:hypothetical protein [Anaerolineaceae bacterium]